jgi:hypothetical protein
MIGCPAVESATKKHFAKLAEVGQLADKAATMKVQVDLELTPYHEIWLQ